jgi:hypothetical protein
VAGLRELGLGGPCGERRERRGKHWAGVERRKGWWACAGRGRAGPRERGKGKQAGCWALPSSFSFPFSLLLSTTQTNLFEFKKKLEFKSHELNTKKTMLQHECTNMLTL